MNPSYNNYDFILYDQSPYDSGNLETGTNVITATAEASGIDNADFAHEFAALSPAVTVNGVAVASDSRIAFPSLAEKLSVTPSVLSGATLNCRVYVDSQDGEHRLFDVSMTTEGQQLFAASSTTGSFPFLFDGEAHTLYFFFWMSSGTTATVSELEFWYGPGTNGNWWNPNIPLAVTNNFAGKITGNMTAAVVGSGSPDYSLSLIYAGGGWLNLAMGQNAFMNYPVAASVKVGFAAYSGGGAATDICVVTSFWLTLEYQS